MDTRGDNEKLRDEIEQLRLGMERLQSALRSVNLRVVALEEVVQRLQLGVPSPHVFTPHVFTQPYPSHVTIGESTALQKERCREIRMSESQ